MDSWTSLRSIPVAVVITPGCSSPGPDPASAKPGSASLWVGWVSATVASPAWRVNPTVDSCGFLTNVVSEVVGGVTGLRECLRVVSVVSTSPGFVVEVWVAAHVKAVGTVVSGAIVDEIFPVKSSATSLSVRCSGRCRAVAPMLGPAASVMPCGGWVCVAFCSGAFVLVAGLLLLLIELLVGEWESETRASLSLCAMLLWGESDVPVGSDSVLIFVTLIGSHCFEVVDVSDASDSLPSPEPEFCEISNVSFNPLAIVVNTAASLFSSELQKEGIFIFGREGRAGSEGSKGREGREGKDENQPRLVSGGFSLGGVGPQRASSSACPWSSRKHQKQQSTKVRWRRSMLSTGAHGPLTCCSPSSCSLRQGLARTPQQNGLKDTSRNRTLRNRTLRNRTLSDTLLIRLFVQLNLTRQTLASVDFSFRWTWFVRLNLMSSEPWPAFQLYFSRPDIKSSVETVPPHYKLLPKLAG